MDQKSIQKSMGKSRERNIRFGRFLGGAHHARAMAGRGLSDPLNQTPLELGMGLGLGKGKGLGTDKHRHKGKGKDTGQVGKNTHSRRRAKRGGGYIYIYIYIYIFFYIIENLFSSATALCATA